jgi:single-strand DNA-binding protein
MNNVQLIGRLTADPELRHTQSGTACTRFNIAVDRRVKQGEEKQTDFITIVAWQQRAEFICKYFSKGQRIAMTGSIRTGSYTDRDGNKRNTFEVWAENVEFCESKSEKAQPPSQNKQEPKKGTVPDVSMEYDMNADLPF